MIDDLFKHYIGDFCIKIIGFAVDGRDESGKPREKVLVDEFCYGIFI